MNELGSRYPTAVLGWVGPDGFPLSVRVPVEVDPQAQRVRIGTDPVGLPLTQGRACLTAHRHEPQFAWQENFQVRGDLVPDNGGWVLIPHKLIGGMEVPKGLIARNRMFIDRTRRHYRTARERLRSD
jgi:hypothetical protein